MEKFVLLIILANVVSTLISAEEMTCEQRLLKTIYVKLITTESVLQSRIKRNKESFLEEIDMIKQNITQQSTTINEIKTKDLETASKLGEMIENLTVFAEGKEPDTINKLNEIVKNVTVTTRELNTVLTATDGGWSPWSSWTMCPESCLGGLTIRTRSCTNPVPSTHGHGCVGNDKEVDICNSVMCPDVDDCAEHKCRNGAVCVDELYRYSCNCSAGFTGEYCDTYIDECSGQPCQNGATCIDGVASFSCLCITVYTGTNCDSDIDYCSPRPCKNGATCVDGITSYTCNCGFGFTGTNCESDIDDCIGQTCSSGTVCIDGVAGYSCVCPTGFTGANCQTVLPECSTSSSKLHCNCTVECQYAEDEVMCECRYGYINEFVTIPNKVLSGFNLISPTVSGPAECMELCVNTTGCLTCELQISQKSCWINFETPYSQPSSYNKDLDYEFYFRKCAC